MLEFQFKQETYSQENFLLVQQLQKRWNEIHTQTNVFRYKLGEARLKVFGSGYVLQLNPDRGVKRRQPEEMNDICQPFDSNKFNFTKISDVEILFKFWEKGLKNKINVVLVNVSPINKYHSLLCPFLHDKLPQVITLESLRLVLDIYKLAQDRDLRIAFNSLCALASVNHLHYHLMFEKQTLPCETVTCQNRKGPVWLTEHYPIPGFCFDGTLPNSAGDIYKLIEHLLKNAIAHNVFITRGDPLITVNDKNVKDSDGLRVFVWPRKSTAGVKQLTAFNVAALELSGYFAVYSAESFENLNEETLESELCKWALDDFKVLSKEVMDLF